MNIAIIGLGEAGRAFASGLAREGAKITGFDPADIETPSGVNRASTITDAVSNASLVLSMVSGSMAAEIAAQTAEILPHDAVYLDLNSTSPSVKIRAKEALGSKSSSFIDGALMGSVPDNGHQTEIIVSGPHAEHAVDILNHFGGNATSVGSLVGEASEKKLLRSIFVKGLGALLVESVEAAGALGRGPEMTEIIEDYLSGGNSTLTRIVDSTRHHAIRRSQEMQDALAMLNSVGRDWKVVEATVMRHKLSAIPGCTENTTTARLEQIPTSALGDGKDRLGFVNETINPVWRCNTVAGRALTVLAQPGDNSGVHAAIKIARPGDVLVVSSGGHTNRALMGEIIAERCRAAGIKAFVTDGSVRDRYELEDLRFPVWAAGISPAGPYKVGPYRINVPVSIGGAVCQPGDFVVADGDGILFIPAVDAASWASAGEAVVREEARRLAAIREDFKGQQP